MMIPRACLTQISCFAFFLLLNFSNLSAEDQFEIPPTLIASKILPKELLKSANHQVAENVSNDGYMNTYRITSPFGEFSARSKLHLESKVYEIAVISEIKKKYPSTTVAKDAALQTGEKILTAPVKAVNKAVDTVSDPEALKKTARAIPGGAKKLFSFAASAVSSGAEYLYDTSKNAFNDEEKDSSSSKKNTIGDAVDYISEKALDYSGYNRAVSDLMKEYALNPYTDNEVLLSEIRRIASIKSSIGVSGKFVPGIPLPVVGSFNSYVGKANSLAAYEDPKKIATLNQKMLDAIGSAEGKKPGWESKFMSNEAYTPITRSILLNNLKLLSGVPGLSSFIESASNAQDREIAGYYMVASTQLLAFHQKREPLQVVVMEANLPAGIGKSGNLFIPIPVDHLVWTKEVSKIFHGFRERVIKKYQVKIKSVEIQLAGTVTKKCQAELKKLGTTQIIENKGYL